MRARLLLAPMLLAACAARAPSSPRSVTTQSPATRALETTASPPATPVDPRTARLARLARVWGELRYVHPYLWEGRGIDWDAALVETLPKVERAENDDEEAAALASMLAVLKDPITRIESPAPAAPPDRSAKTSATWASSTLLVVRPAPRDWGDIDRDAADLKKEVAKAKLVVVDLRAAAPDDSWRAAMVVDALGGALAAHDCVAPAMRGVMHSGYRPQTGTTSGGYFTAVVSAASAAFVTASTAHPDRVVFLVNDHTTMPDLALAMQRAGDGAIVAQGALRDPAIDRRRVIPLAAGKKVAYRATELDATLAADVELPSSTDVDGGPALARAVQLVKDGWPARHATTPASLPPAVWTPDATYPDEETPTREHRLLALFRFWNVIRLFYPYLRSMEPGAWDRALTDSLGPFEDATDVRAYALAIAALAARIPDSHVQVRARALWDFYGWPVNHVTIQRVEGQPVITRLGDPEKAAGLRVGDVVVAVDGEPFEARAARVRPYVAASNPWTLARDADTLATGGPKDSEAVLRVRGQGGIEREARLRRSAWSPRPSTSPAYELVDGGAIGYVDMGALEVAEVDPMFAALGATRAIVFDTRGGTRGTMWPITLHLNVHGPIRDAQLSRPLVGFTGNPGETDATYTFFTRLVDDDRPKYRGKTIVLVDERTQSQAESTAMMFQAACGATIVGSRTAGADGDITSACLPGGICVSFTGHDVRFADGRPLQRVGIAPDVEVRPTIAGLRAGRDEVLDRARTLAR